MQHPLLPLSLSLLLTVPLPAFGQVSEAGAGSALERARPLNLSLPRSDAVPVVWSARVGSDEAVSGNPNAGENDRPAARGQGRRSGQREDGALPYGTGYEARQRSGANDRGMGRGR